MRVLLATDGSSCAEQAIGLLSHFPLPKGSSIRLLMVLDSSLFEAGEQARLSSEQRETLAQSRRQLEEESSADLERTAERMHTPEQQWDTLVVSGDPAEAILTAADDWDADLIVVGSHGQGEISRFLLGSVSDHVMRYAACSVLVVRPDTQGHIERVLLAYDDSPPARAAVELLTGLPFDGQVNILALSVLPLVKLFRQDVRQRLSWAWQQKKQLTKQALEALRTDNRWQGPQIKTNLLESESVSQTILEQADAERADLIVLGHKGRNALQRLLLGSACMRVAHHAHCSVLVARAIKR